MTGSVVAFQRKALHEALTHCLMATSRGVPVLGAVLIAVRNGSATLTACDLDLSVRRIVVPHAFSGDCDLGIHAETLQRIVAALPETAIVQLESNESGTRIVLTAEEAGVQAELANCFPVSEFPTYPSMPDGARHFDLPSTVLRWMIESVACCISTEETRYYLNGVYLHHFPSNEIGPQLRMVSTDGHRLACVNVPAPAGSVGMPGAIIPRTSLPAILASLGSPKSDHPIRISVTGAKLRIIVGNAEIITKLIDGTFPDYSRVVPNPPRIMTFRSVELEAAVRLGKAIYGRDSGRQSHAVALDISYRHDSAYMKASSADAGSLRRRLAMAAPLKAVSGDSLMAQPDQTIGFNSGYAPALLKRLKSSEIEISVTDGASPMIWKAKGQESAFYVLMPMRV